MRIRIFIILWIISYVLKYQSVNARPSRNKSISAQNQIDTSFFQAVEGYTFCMEKITPDSSSLFRAMSFFLWGDEIHHKKIRANVANYAIQNYEETGPTITNAWPSLSMQEYYNAINEDQTFPTTLEILLLSYVFKVNVLVYVSKPRSKNKLEHYYEDLINPQYPVLTLFFYHGEDKKSYYNLLIKNEFFPLFSQIESNKNTYGVHSIIGDGNCMFRAMSFILWETESRHQQLRSEVTKYINDNWDKYEVWVVAVWEISTAEEYFRHMNKDQIFASELECAVLAELYELNLKIYRAIKKNQFIKIVDNENETNYKTARLLFSGATGKGHFEVLFKLND